jgi:hypothetical protein
MGEFLGLQRRLASLAFDTGQLLLDQAFRALNLHQVLQPSPASAGAGAPHRQHSPCQRRAAAGPLHGAGFAERLKALPARLFQDLAPSALLRETGCYALFKPIAALLLTVLLRFERRSRLRGAVNQRLAFDQQLSASLPSGLRLFALRCQSRVPGLRRVRCGLGALPCRRSTHQPILHPVEPNKPAGDLGALLLQSRQLLADRQQPGLEKTGGLVGSMTQGPNLFLPQQVGQQGLDLGIAVGAELTLALCRKHRREEGVGAATDGLDTAGVGFHLAIGHRAVVKTHRLPAPVRIQQVQIGFRATPTIEADHDLRSVASALVRPGQILLVLGQVDVVVVREAAWTGHRRSGRHRQVRLAVFDERGLAPPVGAGDGDELGTIGQALEIQCQNIETKTVADAAKALEGECERLHGGCPRGGHISLLRRRARSSPHVTRPPQPLVLPCADKLQRYRVPTRTGQSSAKNRPAIREEDREAG